MHLMLHTCVQRFDVTCTVRKILATKQDLSFFVITGDIMRRGWLSYDLSRQVALLSYLKIKRDTCFQNEKQTG